MLHGSVGEPELVRIDHASMVSIESCATFMLRVGSVDALGFDAESYPAASSTPRRRSRAALPTWRLRRVEAYIDANIEESVTLATLARVVNLSPMHFAAQFRAATGLRPHEFLLRRRINHAQAMLADPRAKLVDVALRVGFQTQAHFTTVFKRFVGETPHRWRCQANIVEGAFTPGSSRERQRPYNRICDAIGRKVSGSIEH